MRLACHSEMTLPHMSTRGHFCASEDPHRTPHYSITTVQSKTAVQTSILKNQIWTELVCSQNEILYSDANETPGCSVMWMNLKILTKTMVGAMKSCMIPFPGSSHTGKQTHRFRTVVTLGRWQPPRATRRTLWHQEGFVYRYGLWWSRLTVRVHYHPSLQSVHLSAYHEWRKFYTKHLSVVNTYNPRGAKAVGYLFVQGKLDYVVSTRQPGLHIISENKDKE